MESPDQIRARFSAMPDETLQARARSDVGADERAVALDILREREQKRGAGQPTSGASDVDDASLPFLGLAGLLAMVVGGWYLFVAPGPEGSETITLHRLASGATLLIVGAVWTAAQWRPR